jgi:hypothetical protein
MEIDEDKVDDAVLARISQTRRCIGALDRR